MAKKKITASGRKCASGVLNLLPHVMIGTARRHSLAYVEAFIAAGRGPIDKTSIAAYVQSPRGMNILSRAKADLVKLIDQIARESSPRSPSGYLNSSEVTFVLGYTSPPPAANGLEKHVIQDWPCFDPKDVKKLINWSI